MEAVEEVSALCVAYLLKDPQKTTGYVRNITARNFELNDIAKGVCSIFHLLKIRNSVTNGFDAVAHYSDERRKFVSSTIASILSPHSRNSILETRSDTPSEIKFSDLSFVN